MATLAEKLRACAVLGGFGAVDVEDSDGVWRQVLTLSSGDIVDIADALEERDNTSCAANTADAPEVRLEEREASAEPVAWFVQTLQGARLFMTRSEAEAAFSFFTALPLYLRPPAPEPLPTREDLETVLRECLKISDLHLGVRGLGLREEGEQFAIFAICEWDDEFEDGGARSFPEAIAKAAALLRGKKAEG